MTFKSLLKINIVTPFLFFIYIFYNSIILFCFILLMVGYYYAKNEIQNSIYYRNSLEK